MIFFDTETVGFHGMAVTIQWAENDGPINILDVWIKPVRETLALIEKFINDPDGIVGFNLSFDWFHLIKLYTTFSLLPPDAYPEDIINEIAYAEMRARDGKCIKPRAACDLMLHARRGPYQVLMERKDIRIKKVPALIAYRLAYELERRVKLDKIFFSRRKNKYAPQWGVYDIKDNNEFKDIVLKFAASSGLKTLAAHALKLPPDDILLFQDIEPGKQYLPVELGYAPYALAIGNESDWRGAWPEVIKYHLVHWKENKLARQYAAKDVDLTRRLYKHFGSPPLGDDDSELACMVAACRWKGYELDIDGLKDLRKTAKKRIAQVPTSPQAVMRWLEPTLTPEDRLVLGGTTKKTVLEKLSTRQDVCGKCEGEGCNNCKGGKVKTEAAKRAKAILEARFAKYEINFFTKLIRAGRLHPDLNVIGALSSRMSGTSGLNVQGIKKVKEVRSKFPMAIAPLVLLGGDFKSFEVVIAIAVYNDDKLMKAVTELRECYKCKGLGKTEFCYDCKGKGKVKAADGNIRECGKCRGLRILEEGDKCFICHGKRKIETKIHALMGTLFYPHLSYQQVVESDGADPDYYTKSKSGFFAMIYGGQSYTLQNRLGVEAVDADAAYERITIEFPKVGEHRRGISDKFCSMRQPGGIGTKVIWHEPDDYIEEPVMGHRRYFTLENMIAKELFLLANKLPLEWRAMEHKVVRRDRVQTIGGAISSALYAAAFALQAANTRAANNHEIQSAGAKITKYLQRKLWELQPIGVQDWVVQPLNIHDEILCPTHPDYIDAVNNVVKTVIQELKAKVPLLAIDWKPMRNWAEKK